MLKGLGLSAFFTDQILSEHLKTQRLGRVTAVHRSLVKVFDGVEELSITTLANYQTAGISDRPTVGDWVLLDGKRTEIERILERKSVLQRLAAGEKSKMQLLAANVDILFIVTSCNEEFKESRLERYFAMATDARVKPVVVLTKIDLSDDPKSFETRVRQVQADVPVVAIDARQTDTFDGLTKWIDVGSTVAVTGSSGVGKSTILNTLMNTNVTATGEIRAGDKKGRHTTSHRALYQLPNGGLLIDLPGIRELKVTDIESASAEVFGDIEALAAQCRFHNCQHDREPGCTVKRALENDELSQRRFENYVKLRRERELNGTSAVGRDTKQSKLRKKSR